MRFWANPEFVRHIRAELRPARALTVGLLVVVISGLAGLYCWAAVQGGSTDSFARLFYLTLMVIQAIMLGLWCLGTCGQAISRERELKTYDFLKTTRLTPGELLVGKLVGAPVVAYFALACSLPISLVAGLFAHYSPGVLLVTYLLIAGFALFLALAGLWLSMLVDRSGAGAALLGLLLLGPLFGLGYAMLESPFPGFAAISVPLGIISLYEAEARQYRATLFGMQMPLAALNLVFYASLAAWLVLMLKRNLKKDLEEIRLLTSWQVVGLAAFLNILFYAFLDPKRVGRGIPHSIGPGDLAQLTIGLNAIVLFVVGLAALAPRERLKIWWRRRAAGEESCFSADGLPWPWMVFAGGIACTLLGVQAAALSGRVAFREWGLPTAALQLLVFLIFAVRDVLFIQWCMLTRMRRPVLKGFLYLTLYYFAVGVILFNVASLVSEPLGRQLAGAWMPFLVFQPEGLGLKAAGGIYTGMVLQTGIILLLLHAINSRLERPAVVVARAAA